MTTTSPPDAVSRRPQVGASILRVRFSAAILPYVAMLTATTLGLCVRLLLVSQGDGFPLNDGGMFYAMVEDLKASGLRVPEYTSYNGGSIPFAYPPAGFYLAAVISDLGGVSTLDLLIWLPLVFSVLTIPAFYLLARELLPSRQTAGIAVLVFAFIPRSFNWEIVGGGLTRSPGLFFAVLTLWQGYLLHTQHKTRSLVMTVVFGSMTVLFHPELGWFAVFSVALFAVAKDRSGEGLRRGTLALAGIALLTAPWWVERTVTLGLDVMLAAAQTGKHSPLALLSLLFYPVTEEPFFPLAGALGLLGVLACYRDRHFLLPVWLLAILLLDPRKAPTEATIPLAMLAAVGVRQIVSPLLTRDWTTGARPFADSGLAQPALAVLGGAGLLYMFAGALLSGMGEYSPLAAVSNEQRESMQWVEAHTPAEAVFLVMPTSDGWATDAVTEWFPVLAGRRNATTVQGSEWLGASSFEGAQQAFIDVRDCQSQGVECLEDWLANYRGAYFSHIFLPSTAADYYGDASARCCPDLYASLRGDGRYVLIHEAPGGSIFEARKLK
jgi:Dolichyl-phosphate-mannose-protein mannosyltransferase